MAGLVVVLAEDHPVRDAWVDEQARKIPPEGRGVEVSDGTYRGLWRLPVPERTVVHLFAGDQAMPTVHRVGCKPMPVSYRCVRGDDCPAFREGFGHAHGIYGHAETLSLNHRAGCRQVTEHYDRETGELSCACGAAVRR